MNTNKPLYWNQGLFLTPQHFQQQDLYHQWCQQAAWRLVRPFGWGVADLRIRDEGLENGEFDVLSCELVTREGLILQAGSDVGRPNAVIAPRKFDELLSPAGPPLSVFLGVPRFRVDGPNVQTGVVDDGQPLHAPRYRLIGETRSDLFDREAPDADVNVMLHNIVVLFDRDEGFAQISQVVSIIKVAELLPRETGVGGRLSLRYIPPCLSVSASPVLFRRLKDLRDLVTARSREFAEFARRRGGAGTARSTREIVRTMMVKSLNRYTALLTHMTEHGTVHPETAYCLLREMVGEFLAYAPGNSAPGASGDPAETAVRLPPYDHDNILAGFEPALQRLKELISSLSAGPEMGISLDYDGEYYRAQLPSVVFKDDRNRFYLMIDGAFDAKELWQRLQRTGKIAALERMPEIRTTYTMGLSLEVSPPPEDLPQREGRTHYFAVDINSEHWLRIRQFSNIAVYCRDLDPRETSIRLYVLSSD